jgi:hypothetical protein
MLDYSTIREIKDDVHILRLPISNICIHANYR